MALALWIKDQLFDFYKAEGRALWAMTWLLLSDKNSSLQVR